METKLLLKFYGIIDLGNFWPNSKEVDSKVVYGQCSADTIKILIDRKQGFLTKSHPYASEEKTKIFNHVLISGTEIRPPVDSKGYVTVRLQGVSAPELHYKPDIRKAKMLTQHFGQTAVVELQHMLRKHSLNNKIKCVAKTYVEKPEDAFDCRARFIGDVIILKDDREFLNINHWLAEEGLVYPCFYTSMTNGEIRTIQLMVKSAISKKNVLWEHHYHKKLEPVENLSFELKRGRKVRYTPSRDKKLPVYMPKIFRRQYKYELTKNGKSFKSFLLSRKEQDRCCLLDDFFKDGAKENNMMPFGNLFSSNGDILFKPWEVVFEEAESKLLDDKTKRVIKNLEF
ncbi:MAG: thermonuclease family protein [Ignavibacteriae bacterium]|nr:thermonuclease family protein [Ignavibacteriota bacterium]